MFPTPAEMLGSLAGLAVPDAVQASNGSVFIGWISSQFWIWMQYIPSKYHKRVTIILSTET
jgi:hypothetical protein